VVDAYSVPPWADMRVVGADGINVPVVVGQPLAGSWHERVGVAGSEPGVAARLTDGETDAP
jgi:hypothetical protein